MRNFLVAVLFFGAACGTPALKKNGESCVASSECDKGLLCSAAGTCEGQGELPNVDAGIDGFVHPPIDGSGAPPIDAPPDAAPDAAPDAM